VIFLFVFSRLNDTAAEVWLQLVRHEIVGSAPRSAINRMVRPRHRHGTKAAAAPAGAVWDAGP